MKEVNQFKISETSFNDYAKVVDLFNKNQVYQFPDGIPLITLLFIKTGIRRI